jgi:hypothetical protein
VDFNTPRTSRRPSACDSASEIRLPGIAADAALHAIVGIAAEPIVVAFARVRVGPALRIAALHGRERSPDGRCRRGMCRMVPLMMMAGHDVLRPGRGNREHGADRDDRAGGALHGALLLSRHKKKSQAHDLMAQQKYKTGVERVNREAA